MAKTSKSVANLPIILAGSALGIVLIVFLLVKYFGVGPKVTDATPTAGPPTGATVVTINGTNFRTDAKVKFGAEFATKVEFINSTMLRATTPPSSQLNSTNITILQGMRESTLTSGFRYEDNASLQSVTPTFGPVGGGTEVTIKGTGFAKDSYFDLGGQGPVMLTYVDQHTVRVRMPAHAEGKIDVSVITGEDETTLPESFTYTK